MKVILTGSTGFIGSHVLQQCISNPSITSIIVLSRRQLNPEITHPKLKVILHSNFTTYAPELQTQFADADACIYCLGTGAPIKPPELNRKVNLDYALSTARMFASLPRTKTRNFRFVYLSGALVEKDPEKRLWIIAEVRKMRGELELELIQFEKEKKGTGFEIFIARPALVLNTGSIFLYWLVGLIWKCIFVSDLSASLVEVPLCGYSRILLENEDLVVFGRKASIRSDS